jgi:hypothetical protein
MWWGGRWLIQARAYLTETMHGAIVGSNLVADAHEAIVWRHMVVVLNVAIVRRASVVIMHIAIICSDLVVILHRAMVRRDLVVISAGAFLGRKLVGVSRGAIVRSSSLVSLHSATMRGGDIFSLAFGCNILPPTRWRTACWHNPSIRHLRCSSDARWLPLNRRWRHQVLASLLSLLNPCILLWIAVMSQRRWFCSTVSV